MGRLNGKVALITGGAKGLGEADARLFAKEGAKVILTDVDCNNGQRVADEIGDVATFMELDVRKEDAWKKLIDDVVKTHGGLNILVNNAGVVEPGNIETQTLEDFQFVMDVSAQGTFLGSKYAIPAMRDSGTGSIINMASIASVQGESYVAAYSAAKGAVESLTRATAAYFALNKIPLRCNSVHPSGIETPMVMSMPEKMAEKGLVSLNDASEASGQSKLGEPDDIANTVLFLATDEAKFINGASIRVDNAMSIIAGAVA